MVAESRFNPAAIVLHALGIAAGLLLGFLVMDAIAPDLPPESEAPGVSSSVAPEKVGGGDADSLFVPSNLGSALDQLDEQTAAGQGILRMRITPGEIQAQTAAGDGLIDAAEVPETAPETIVARAGVERAQIGFEDFAYFDLVATDEGPQWYAQLDINVTEVDPPWTYTAPLIGAPLTTGGPPPAPIDAEPEQEIEPAPVPPS
jgi:hypothetical protein